MNGQHLVDVILESVKEHNVAAEAAFKEIKADLDALKIMVDQIHERLMME